MDDVGFLLRHADYRTTQRVYVHTKAIDIKRRMEELS
jgi:integrase